MKTPTYFTEIESPLGNILLTATEAGLSGLYFHDQRYVPESREGWIRADDKFGEIRLKLRDFFSGASPVLEVPMDVQRGTPFQREVWQALNLIPVGETWTYAQLAKHLGKPLAVRAVGAAVGQNPLSLIVPCHRVVGSSGSLTGYAGGLERKRWLLAHEAGLVGLKLES